jgi:chitin-binding protein
VVALNPPPQWQDAGAGHRPRCAGRRHHPDPARVQRQGNDLERPEITLAAGQTADQWPLALARKVNASAQQARVGVMKNGVITPVASATENRVYLKPGNRFQLDTRVPGRIRSIRRRVTTTTSCIRPVSAATSRAKPWSRAPTASCTPAARSRKALVQHQRRCLSPGHRFAWRDAWIAY